MSPPLSATIRTLQEAEILRGKETRVLRRHASGRGEERDEQGRSRNAHQAFFGDPGMPGEVIASGERI